MMLKFKFKTSMKEEFYLMTKASLEDCFANFLVPKLRIGQLKNSKKIDGNLSLREHLGLVILSLFFSKLHKSSYAPAILNQEYDDGVVVNIKTRTYYRIEQVYIYEETWDEKVTEGIKDALKRKKKGNRYAEGSYLFIFCNAVGNFNPNEIRDFLKKCDFKWIILAGPMGEEEFSYYIYLLKDNGYLRHNLFKLSINASGDRVDLKKLQ